MIIVVHTHLNNYHEDMVFSINECIDSLEASMAKSGTDQAMVLTSYKVTPDRSTASVIEAIDGRDHLHAIAGIGFLHYTHNDLREIGDYLRSRCQPPSTPDVVGKEVQCGSERNFSSGWSLPRRTARPGRDGPDHANCSSTGACRPSLTPHFNDPRIAARRGGSHDACERLPPSSSAKCDPQRCPPGVVPGPVHFGMSGMSR